MIDQNELRDTASSSNVFINPLISGVAYVPGTVITYILRGSAGDTGDHGGSVWTQFGRRASFESALQAWSAVANITFVEAPGAYSATNTSYDWVEGFSNEAVSILGSHNLPMAGTLTGAYNLASGIYSTATTGAGSMAHSTFVHEIGHGLGLLHPHNDEGDPIDDPVFPGVNDPFSLGSNNQNQGIFSVMSYNGGYVEVGLSPSDEFGWEYGPMAFDIAAIQLLYGANLSTNAGATTYVLPQANVAGTGWRCIWDGGGSDTISAQGMVQDAIIDLREANLLSGPEAGGYVSRLAGVLGGFTIAAGATIENATGGSGDDRIMPNSVSNQIDGGGGWDTVVYTGTAENLTINLQAGTVIGSGGDTLTSIENAVGGNGNDILVARQGQFRDLSLSGLQIDTFIGTSQLSPIQLTNFSSHQGDPNVRTGPGIVTASAIVSGPYANFRFFEIIVPNAGTVVTFDIDQSFAADMGMVLIDANGSEIAVNQDCGALDFGSANILDPYLNWTTTANNQHLILRVQTHATVSNVYSPSYTLHVSMTGTPLASNLALIGSRLEGGAGSDTLIGADGIDTLIGGDGNDILDGGTNADILDGGSGSDTFIVRDARVSIIDGDGYYANTVITYVSFTLPGGVADLEIAPGIDAVCTGNQYSNRMTGNELDNQLFGLGGSDILIGGGGNDVLWGGDDNDNLMGQDGHDLLYGQQGNDWLTASQSGSADELYGGVGDDSYVVSRQDDVIFEYFAEGYDRIYCYGSYYMYDNVEWMQLMGTSTLFGVGNSMDNSITGNVAANLLLGGAGADVLLGWEGDDSLFGESGNDSLYGGFGVDYLVGGAGNDIVFGQKDADAIYGEDGDDVLYADTRSAAWDGISILPSDERPSFVTDILVGGAGNDTLYANSGLADYDLLDGGSGNDTFWVDTGDDLTFEAEGGGVDTVHADVLIANAGVYLYANVENLILEGTTSFGVGNALDNQLTGSASGNWLLGGSGNDTINGRGGNDVLFGEDGADTFVFEESSGADVVGDFQHGVDHIRLVGSWTSFDQVASGFHQNGSDGAIDLGSGNLIVLQGVQLSSLTTSDFIFG